MRAAPFDRLTLVVSAASVLLLLPVGAAILLVGQGANRLWGALILVLLGAAWALSPTGYRIEGDDLVVERRGLPPRRIGDVVTASRETDGVHRISLFSTIRLMGSGGLFGWYGSFWNRRAGRYLAYLTDRTRVVLIERGAEPDVIISPHDPDAFVADWQESTRV